jgi:uncharacterized protein (TIGR00297 family)
MKGTLRIGLRLAAGALGGGIVALAAYRLGALTASGAWAATACGTLVYGGGGGTWAALLGAFFATSSAFTRIEPSSRASGRRSLDYPGRRWDQVAANGGVAALAAAAHGLTDSPLALVAGAGAVAAATADTWATELGRQSPTAPRLITTWARVPHGTSGAITPLGTIGAVSGALLIGALTALLSQDAARMRRGAPRPCRLAAAVAAAGFSGSLFDSVLGATIEGRWRWVGNDVVNLMATTWGAVAAALLQISHERKRLVRAGRP